MFPFNRPSPALQMDIDDMALRARAAAWVQVVMLLNKLMPEWAERLRDVSTAPPMADLACDAICQAFATYGGLAAVPSGVLTIKANAAQPGNLPAGTILTHWRFEPSSAAMDLPPGVYSTRFVGRPQS